MTDQLTRIENKLTRGDKALIGLILLPYVLFMALSLYILNAVL